ncbi:MAG: prevent-host-death protein [Candidatus Pacebacteria bacterium CG10_big_fil_rev_8_21_14_0_10_56_10]|nr:MAG: prevent-host-death protein [Candidatus Pacebacteria bacterium CG10_big_fil_rev_8_21_14_0_10_56_10]
MLTVNIHQAKANLSRYIDLVQKGQRVIVAKRNVPVAELKLLAKPKPKRAVGQSKVKFEVPESFFEPLPGPTTNSFANPK